MRDSGTGHPTRDRLLLVGIAILARVLFLRVVGPRTISFDLQAWLTVGRFLAAGEDPYAKTTILNYWPPFWVQVLSVLRWLSSMTGISLTHVIQIFLITAESFLIAVAARLLEHWRYPSTRTLLLLGISLNPIPILLVCQHGNFDVLVGLAILLFLAALTAFEETGEPSHWLLACFFLGIGTAMKSAPIILAPLLLSGVRGISHRLRFLGAFLTIGPTTYGLSILALVHPGSVVNSILTYRSLPGWFGITGLMHLAHQDFWIGRYSRVFTALLAVGLGTFASTVYRSGGLSRKQLVLGTAVSLMAIPLCGSGYGPQYIYWFWPVLLLAYAVGTPRLRRTLLLYGAIATGTYVFEYAVMESLGAFLSNLYPSPETLFASWAMRSSRLTTVVGLPLFLMYGVTVGISILEFRAAPAHRAASASAQLK